MAPVAGSLRGTMRGASSQSVGNNRDSIEEKEIQMQGWMRKQKETLRSWPRRYFDLKGKVLTYYDDENTSRQPRGVLEFVDVSPLTTEHNGLILHLVGGKEVRLIADTHVAYTAWMAVLSAAVKKPKANKSRASKEGWAHCLTDEDVWTRYFLVVKNDSFSCFESEEEDAELALSGLVRSIAEWDGKRYGLLLGLNRARKIQLCFDSAEEKMTWFLTLEFAATYGTARMKKEASMKAIESANPVSKSDASTTSNSQTSQENAEDDGVWI